MANTFTNATKALLTDAFSTGSQANVDLYTTPVATTSIVHSLFISNIDTVNAASVDIAVDNGAIFYVARAIPVPAGSTLYVEGKINLLTGERLKVRANAAGDLHAFASILERD